MTITTQDKIDYMLEWVDPGFFDMCKEIARRNEHRQKLEEDIKKMKALNARKQLLIESFTDFINSSDKVEGDWSLQNNEGCKGMVIFSKN